MGKANRVSSSHANATAAQKHTVKSKKKSIYAAINPMMPRGYTAVQRAQLRKFERELYAGRTVTVE